MAIVAYTGLPRSGKSYGVVEHQILPALKAGRQVVTNIPLRLEVIAADYPGAAVRVVDNDEVAADGFFQDETLNGSLVVLDELWRLWPSGLKANQAKEEHKAFLAEHGHRVDASGNTMAVVLVTQDLAQVAAWVRALVDKTYRAVKLDAVGSTDRYRVDVYRGPVTGPNPPTGSRLNEVYGRYREQVWRYYKSAMHSDTGEVGNEASVDKRASIWRNKGFLGLCASSVLLLGFAGWQLPGLFDFQDDAEASVQEPEPEPEPAPRYDPAPGFGAPIQPEPEPESEPQPEPRSRQPEPEPEGPRESEDWRLAGLLEQEGTQWAILRGSGGVIRRVEDPDCKNSDSLHTAECVFRGEVVAAWTGPQHRRQAGVVPTDTEGRGQVDD